ncbi:MAG: DUF72 domain-containing protein [Planctomycetes bacterium]|nr:DUF72 domain-containing protein [Planctomycetota bacterium]MBM4080038.1 DUF72 domain-containing protein [Planctomycetota bacterium]MBM4085742.1 DUF72 domain-containing protein [Planctomycetota bacterium]
MADLYVGTSGWSYPDWKGVVYPPEASRGELPYYAQFFDAVEINSTFYRPPQPNYARKWLNDVKENPRFKFTLKLWQRFTHERGEKWKTEEADTFKAGIAPLADSGKLGAVLMQFPWSFPNTESNREWVAELARTFGEHPLVLEVRHATWNTKPALDFLRQNRLNFCNIDQPVTRSSIPPTSLATGPLAYYRFHGRNYENWFKKDAGRDDRYNYLYSEAELKPWTDQIAEMAKRIEQIYIMANNHYRGQAPVNALQMKSALTGERVRVPATLIQYYPVLRGVASGTGVME